jgi:glycosyltransferase involved in cell wall biosynthesis
MKEKPLISIIVPFYNSGKLISNSVNSIKKQKEKNFEVIFINDGSKDNSKELLKELLKDCDFMYRIIDKENEGVSVARNVGIKEANGKYVFFLDADDIIHEDLIKDINQKLKEVTMPDIVYWGYDTIDQKGKILKKYEDHYMYIERNDSLIKEYMLKNFWIWTGSALYKKSFLNANNIYFPTGVARAEDIVFIFNALLKAKDVACIEKVLSYYFSHAKSVTHTSKIKSLHIIKAMYLIESLLQNGTEEKNIFMNKFKPRHYWNMVTGGLLTFDKKDKKTKKMVIRLLKNKFIRKELKIYQPKTKKVKIAKTILLLLLNFPSVYITIMRQINNFINLLFRIKY